ncbi:MAG: hypothetical protein K5849_04755 [Bacteroidales bacterium]|nr:hypothetical protein [Bacteroidales bacterium]
MNKENSIKALQAYATGLAAQSLSHKVQGKVFAAQGFSKLGEKYASHASEEMEWVDQFIDRIIELGGQPKVEAGPEMPIFTDPVEFIKCDLEISRREVPVLQQLTVSLSDDFKTYDLLRGYALDEEEDWAWSEQQLELIEKISLKNWLIKQL